MIPAGGKAGDRVTRVDALVVGAGLSGAACAKRLVDAGLETVIIDKRKLPRHKICSGILSPRGHRFLIENFGPLPREILLVLEHAVLDHPIANKGLQVRLCESIEGPPVE